MAQEPDFAVILIGGWEPISGHTLPVREGPASIWPSTPDSRALRALASSVHPAWLLAGKVANHDDGILMPLVAAARGAIPGIRVAALGVAGDVDRCERWIRSGVAVYLEDTSPLERVVDSMQTAMERDVVISGGSFFRTALLRRAELQANLLAMGGLSAVEVDVLHLLQHGAHNADIAADLHLSKNTVQFHVRNVLSKLSVRNRR